MFFIQVKNINKCKYGIKILKISEVNLYTKKYNL